MTPTATGFLLAAACALAWALLDLLRKALADRHQDPLTLAAIVPMAAAIGATVPGLSAPDLLNPPPQELWGLLAGIIALNILANFLFLYALTIGEISSLLPLLATTPAVGALGGFLVFGETLEPINWLGMAVVVFGIWRLTGGGVPVGRGVWVMGAVALLWGAAPVLDAEVVRRSGWSVTAYVAWVCWLISLPLMTERLIRAPRKVLDVLRRSPWLCLALIPTAALALGTQFASLSYLDVGVAEAVKRSGVIVSVLAGAWLFAEASAWRRLPWALLILAGVTCVAL
jgi:drug/metabolite transporter (DMT)-like permease